MATLEDKSLWENQEADDEVEQEIRRLAPEEINNRTRLLENDIKVLTRDLLHMDTSLTHLMALGHEI